MVAEERAEGVAPMATHVIHASEAGRASGSEDGRGSAPIIMARIINTLHEQGKDKCCEIDTSVSKHERRIRAAATIPVPFSNRPTTPHPQEPVTVATTLIAVAPKYGWALVPMTVLAQQTLSTITACLPSLTVAQCFAQSVRADTLLVSLLGACVLASLKG